MAFGLQSFAIFVGINVTSARPRSIYAVSKRGHPQLIRLRGLSYARCANCNGKAQKVLSSSFPSAGRRLRQLALQGYWSVRRKKPSSKLKSIHTCSGMLAASSWQTMARIRVPSRHTLDTRIFSTLCATRNSHQRGSKIFGRISAPRQLRGCGSLPA